MVQQLPGYKEILSLHNSLVDERSIAKELATIVISKYKDSFCPRARSTVFNNWYNLFLNITNSIKTNKKKEDINNTKEHLKDIISLTNSYEHLGLITEKMYEIINSNENHIGISVEELCKSTKSLIYIYNSWGEKLKETLTPILIKTIEGNPLEVEKYIVISHKIYKSINNPMLLKGFKFSSSNMKNNIKKDIIEDIIEEHSDSKRNARIVSELINPIMKAAGYFDSELGVGNVLKRLFKTNNGRSE